MTGQYVKERIIEAGYKISEVARALSITPQSLDERLSAKDMKVGVLIEIATAIGRPLSYFFEGMRDSLLGDLLSGSDRYIVHREPKSQPDPDLEEKIRLQQEIIAAQRKMIEAYERMNEKSAKK